MMLPAGDRRMRRDGASIKHASSSEAGWWDMRTEAKAWVRNDCDRGVSIRMKMLTSGAVFRQVMALAKISCSRVVRELKPPPAAALEAADADPFSPLSDLPAIVRRCKEGTGLMNR